MARIVKEQEYTEKSNEILDAAQRLLYSKGYERMTIQDILTDLQISSGAFYHYFNSKAILLEALIERMQQEAEEFLLPIINDPHLPALEKLQVFFATLDRLKAANKSFLIGMMRGWYSDDNAGVRQKVNEATIERRTPLVTLIVSQGIQEGVFSVPYANHAAEIIVSLMLSMENSFARLLLLVEQEREGFCYIDDIVDTYTAYVDAIEHVVGAPCCSLYRLDTKTVREWLDVEEVTTR
ncbi:MAG: TetR/AcrR family transcriptional regulator [Desulfosporosinus sp.]|nr:TetR/AcrR family transcriptional regulator [Desulfosporosinus sp.]